MVPENILPKTTDKRLCNCSLAIEKGQPLLWIETSPTQQRWLFYMALCKENVPKKANQCLSELGFSACHLLTCRISSSWESLGMRILGLHFRPTHSEDSVVAPGCPDSKPGRFVLDTHQSKLSLRITSQDIKKACLKVLTLFKV